jgi:cell division protein FtsB
MISRIVPVAILIALLVVIHAQLWTGRGSMPSVAALQRKVDAQKAANAQARQVNVQLASELEDLRSGLGMVEEKARMELGMVKPNEIFVQITPGR